MVTLGCTSYSMAIQIKDKLASERQTTHQLMSIAQLREPSTQSLLKGIG